MDIPKAKYSDPDESSIWADDYKPSSQEDGYLPYKTSPEECLPIRRENLLTPPDICIHSALSDDEDDDVTAYETDPGFYGGHTSDESDFERDGDDGERRGDLLLGKNELMMKDSKIQKFLKKHWGWNNCPLKKRKHVTKSSGYATDTFLHEKSLSEMNLRDCARDKRSDSIIDSLFSAKKSTTTATAPSNVTVAGEETNLNVSREMDSGSRRGSLQDVSKTWDVYSSLQIKRLPLETVEV